MSLNDMEWIKASQAVSGGEHTLIRTTMSIQVVHVDSTGAVQKKCIPLSMDGAK